MDIARHCEPKLPQPTQPGKTKRRLLRAVIASKAEVEPGQPVRILAKLRNQTAAETVTRIDGAVGAERYVTFERPGRYKVPVTVAAPDGTVETGEVEVEVNAPAAATPFPILAVRQEPTSPFLLLFSLKNAAEVVGRGVEFSWTVQGLGTFAARQPFFMLDCERLLNPTDEIVAFDVEFTVAYPTGERRTTKESFRIWNDYAWAKRRGIVRPRLVYDHRARGDGDLIAASCTIVNDDDDVLEIAGKQVEILYDDPDKVFVPGRVDRFATAIQARSRAELDCSIGRRQLSPDALGYAIHFHGRSQAGHKVEASAYFEYYHYHPKMWSDVTSLHAIDLLNEIKAAITETGASVPPPRPLPATAIAAEVATMRPQGRLVATGAGSAALARGHAASSTVSLTTVRSYVDAMRPVWSPDELAARERGLEALLGNRDQLMSGSGDEFWLGKQCLLDEEPPSDNLFCRDSGRRGQVYVPARIINAKKGDVLLVPGGPLGFIGGLLQRLSPPQNFAHCGIMTGNYYKLRHATASEEWLNEELLGKTVLDPDAIGTEGLRPESLKYIWPGSIDQSVEQAFAGSFFKYVSADGKKQKMYRISAFSKDPSFFLDNARHVVFPQVLKPDPLLEGDPAFAHVRPTLAEVAEKAKGINGHYRFYCYSDGAISLADDTAHLAPSRGAEWWASGTRPMVCSTFVYAAIKDLGKQVRLEGQRPFTEETDLERENPDGSLGPDREALVDAQTRDGLYLYTEEERRAAAEFVYQRVYDSAYAKSGDIGRFFTDAPDDAANQVTNTFAFDYSDREFDDEDAKDSDKWKNPGAGRSVSPDDMLLFWDGPRAASDAIHGLYGSSQRMVFREGLLEEREIGVWAIREKIGTLRVTVRHRGGPMAGIDVKVGGRIAVTDANGVARLDLPEARYSVEASGLRDGLLFEGKAVADVKDRATTDVNLDLNDPPEFNRIVMIGGHVRIKDEESFGKDEIHDGAFEPSPKVLRLGPNAKQASATYVRKFGGEIRVEANYFLTWNADLSITVACNVKLFEGTSEDTGDLDGERGDVVVVGKDQEGVPLNIRVRNDAEDDDDYVQLNSLISNHVDL